MKKEYLEILVEEKSMEIFLEKLLPKILPNNFILNQNCFIRVHEGKSHLLKSIPKKAKAYQSFAWPVRMLIIHDQDSNDCKVLKNKLIETVRNHNAEIALLVRISCKELENWYLGDLKAIQQLYPSSNASRQMNKAKFRNPDKLNGAEEMEKFSNQFTKTSCAKEIVTFMDIENNKSPSFNFFITGLHNFLA